MANADTQPVIADAPPAAVQVLRMLWRDKFALRRGSVFGLSHGLSQLSLLRPARRHGASARGLHWVGASTRPGNGVPLVLMGVKVAFDAIIKMHGAGVKAMRAD